jgi:hypothetical protein
MFLVQKPFEDSGLGDTCPRNVPWRRHEALTLRLIALIRFCLISELRRECMEERRKGIVLRMSRLAKAAERGATSTRTLWLRH